MKAWIHLTRLCGCNYKVPTFPHGTKSLMIKDPQQPERRYRINRAKFFNGERQYRNSWCIEKWSERAERCCVAERNWQT